MAWDTDLLKRGYDLANPKLGTEVIAPEFVRFSESAFSKGAGVADSVSNVLGALQGALPSALLTIGSTVSLAVGAILEAKGILEGVASRFNATSTKRELAARDLLFAQRDVTEWRSRFKVIGPAPSDLDLKDQIGGWSASQFLNQYKPPGLVFLRDAGARDFLIATFPTYASDAGGGISFNDGGMIPEYVAKGREERPGFLDKRDAIPPVPEKYGWNYVCDAPGADNDSAIERVISSMRCAPVPGSVLSMSWGAYPFLGPLGEPWPLGPQGAATCLAMQVPTPVWAALSEAQVEKCYRYWLEHSRLRELPRNPKRQLESYEMVLDDDLLPFSLQDLAVPPFAKDLPGITFATKRWASIETSFRRFFALREMAIRQPELLSKSLGDLTASNSDFKRKPRAGYSWADPLGDGWISKGAKPNFNPGFGLKDDTGPERVGRSAEDTLHAIEARHRRELLWYGGAALSATSALGWVLFRRRGNG